MKIAYPNYDAGIESHPPYDLSKWMTAMKNIYIKQHFGFKRSAAIDEITKDWKRMEKLDFLNWMKFYEGGNQNKYKQAQAQYYVNDDINYFLPNPKNLPSPIQQNIPVPNKINQEAENLVKHQQEQLSKEEQRRLIEDQRKKILARLHSAEKLLSSHEGQLFAGQDFEKLLIAIYELKKQIQTTNKISLSSQTIIDLIIRQANKLKHNGFHNASDFMIKFAQSTPGDFSFNLGEVPAGGSQPQGQGSLSNNVPDLFQDKPEKITEESPIGKFFDNLEGAGITDEIDNNSVEDVVDVDDDVVLDQEIIPNENELVVEAQTIPEKLPKIPDIKPQKSNIDTLIDGAFSNLTINDVINKLEDVSSIFKNREIGRQLALVDYMLSRLGIASYFGSLGEAISKNLEGNQYCLTRIEDIISKLRGSVQPNQKINLTEEHTNPNTINVKQNLENEDQEEQKRKEMKKQLRDKEIVEDLKPETNIENVQQELATPAPKVAPTPQLPVK